MAHFRIMWKGYPDETNKVEKNPSNLTVFELRLTRMAKI